MSSAKVSGSGDDLLTDQQWQQGPTLLDTDLPSPRQPIAEHLWSLSSN
jgi:hypothetical protein